MTTLCIVQTRAGRDTDETCVVCGGLLPPIQYGDHERGHVVHVWSDGHLTHIGCQR